MRNIHAIYPPLGFDRLDLLDKGGQERILYVEQAHQICVACEHRVVGSRLALLWYRAPHSVVLQSASLCCGTERLTLLCYRAPHSVVLQSASLCCATERLTLLWYRAPHQRLTIVSQFGSMVADQLFANVHDLLAVPTVILPPFTQLVSHLWERKQKRKRAS